MANSPNINNAARELINKITYGFGELNLWVKAKNKKINPE